MKNKKKIDFSKECPYNCSYNKYDGKGKEGCKHPYPPKKNDDDCYYYWANGD